MGIKVQQGVQYEGIDTIPGTLTDPKGYHQMSVSGKYCTANLNIGFGQVTKVTARIINLHQEVVATPVGRSLEGQKLTGCKLFVAGQIEMTINYIACDGTLDVKVLTFIEPFADYIVLGSQYDSNVSLNLKVYIEDIYVHVIDCTCLSYGLLLLLASQA